MSVTAPAENARAAAGPASTAAAAAPVAVPAARPGVTVPGRSRLARLAASPFLWLFIVALGLSVPVLTRVLNPPPPPLPVLGQLPGFALTDQEGRAFGLSDLQGKVWLAGFIFTRCPTICPAITSTMARIQHRARGIEPAFRLVSFSVDPQYDTPARLKEFAARYKASPRMWTFLTGSFDAMKTTVVDGLKIAMAERPPASAGAGADLGGEQDFAAVMHGTHFVLVDQRGRVRGYYASSNPEVVDRVLADAAMLVNRGD